MSDTTFETQATAEARPSEPRTKPPKTAQTAKRDKKGKRKPAKKSAKKRAAKPNKKASPKAAVERSTKKAAVIDMMKRAKGATLAEIVASTGWQKHTVRGFVSILSKKGGEKIASSKNAAGERTYRIAK